MSSTNFKTYSGNLRLVSIDFDIIDQMWGGNLEEHDPADNEANKFYIGKIGTYVDCSYYHNKYLQAVSIEIEFANGHRILVSTDDVVATDEDVTLSAYLPIINKKDADEDNFKELTTEEKDFADKAVLAMISSSSCKNVSYSQMLEKAINLSILRTKNYHQMLWNKNVGDDEE
jgi:hypothetical protein